ncbi:MAG TPA: TonB family protein [Acidobacteriaceae bacterium]|nr:TonB family protein [Acidobacteriaceae bacterium]
MPRDSLQRDILEIQREPFGRPAAGSLLLHAAGVGILALVVFLNGRFHGNEWGTNAPKGAIQATLVDSAPSIPLPSITPPTPNVLATQLPSPAPAPPSKATIPIQDQNAIPIPTRRPKLREAKKVQPESPKHAQPLNQEDRARTGEAAATQLEHSMANTPAKNTTPVTVTGGDFAARFPWYVNMITRTVQQYWYEQEIDPHTPMNSVAYVTFTISRDGSVSNIHLETPSSSPTLNSSGVRAVQRVGRFPPLPDQYTGSSVSVEYTFTYATPQQ